MHISDASSAQQGDVRTSREGSARSPLLPPRLDCPAKNADVRAILQPVCRLFGANQIFQAKIVRSDGAKMSLDAVLPERAEILTAVDAHQKVDADRSYADLDDPSRIREVLDGVAEVGSAEEHT